VLNGRLTPLDKKGDVCHGKAMRAPKSNFPESSPAAARDAILARLLPDVAFDGWRWEAVEAAAAQAGFDPRMARAVFPGGVPGVIDHFSAWADRRMLEELAGIDIAPLRIRDRVRIAVLKRFDILEPHREAVKLALSFRLRPGRAFGAGHAAWRTADAIWNWAGDTATDYNRYTKRGLLCGVLAATTLAWLRDGGNDREILTSFLDRRIENVMQLGRIMGRSKARQK
jgi:ubiquinone biosynthesis protein COQ9